ncbi:MAG TPA: ABC transporter permease [Candidatus Paceibacterota bacterium]
MRFTDLFKIASSGLSRSRMRSALTMLGIVIGISSVILLMSLGASAERLILDQIRSIGSDLIFVIPGAISGDGFSSPPSAQGVVIKTLVERDVDRLLREPSIENVAPEVRGQARVVFENEDRTVTFQGTTEAFFKIRDFEIVRGTHFADNDDRSLNRVAILGSEISEALFDERDPIGKTIRLKDISFKVIGVAGSEGVGPLGVDQDNIILIPMSIAQKQLLGIDYYNQLTIKANPAYAIEFVQDRVFKTLLDSHRITDPNKEDFTVRSQEDALSILGDISIVLQLFLIAVALISLIVGGIGIMNIMLVSVIERTKEIGLRKSVGATSGDILQQFLLESVILTMIGGIVGTIFGILINVGLYFIISSFVINTWKFSLPASAIILALGVSSVIGIIFGIFPAYKASKKSPIDALRYE